MGGPVRAIFRRPTDILRFGLGEIPSLRVPAASPDLSFGALCSVPACKRDDTLEQEKREMKKLAAPALFGLLGTVLAAPAFAGG